MLFLGDPISVSWDFQKTTEGTIIVLLVQIGISILTKGFFQLTM